MQIFFEKNENCSRKDYFFPDSNNFWYLREKKTVYGRATEQDQAAYAGAQYADYAARKEHEKQVEQLRQQSEETRYVSYDDYKAKK